MTAHALDPRPVELARAALEWLAWIVFAAEAALALARFFAGIVIGV